MDQHATDNYAALLKQRRDLDAQLAEIRERVIDEFKQKVLAEAEELEVDLIALLLPNRARRNGRNDGVPRYRDPENPDNTWSGHGRPPKWLADLIQAGKDKNEFLAGQDA
jgi:DNA-binding protein H-NS